MPDQTWEEQYAEFGGDNNVHVKTTLPCGIIVATRENVMHEFIDGFTVTAHTKVFGAAFPESESWRDVDVNFGPRDTLRSHIEMLGRVERFLVGADAPAELAAVEAS